MNLYSIKDAVSDEYGPVFEAKSDLVAVRVCRQFIAQNKDLPASDFTLFLVGSFDHVTGLLTGMMLPQLISTDLTGPAFNILKMEESK